MSKKKLPRSENIFFDRHKLLLLFLFIYIVLSFFLFDPKLFSGGDNAVYIILAESIVSGEGYKDMYMPDEPPHSQYPFGFPIMLSVPILIFGTNIILLKLLLLLTGLGSVCFMYKIGEYLFRVIVAPIRNRCSAPSISTFIRSGITPISITNHSISQGREVVTSNYWIGVEKLNGELNN